MKNWNNQRRSATYWIFVIMLLATGINVNTVLTSKAFRNAEILIRQGFKSMSIPSSPVTAPAVCMLFFISAGAFGVYAINILISKVDARGRKKETDLFEFMGRKEWIADCIVGLALETVAVWGYVQIIVFFRNLSSGVLGYTILLIVGSVGYWNCIMPVYTYKKMLGGLKKAGTELDSFWYVITNSPCRISSFAVLPGKNQSRVWAVDSCDLEKLNKRWARSISVEDFSKCLILFESGTLVLPEIAEQIRHAALIPHMRVKVFETDGPDPGAGTDLEKIFTKAQKLIYFDQSRYKGNPLNDIEHPELKKAYLNLGRGVGLCFDFMNICIHQLELLPSIYALFDYMDLQYRLCLSFIAGQNTAWFEEHGGKLGNIGAMFALLEHHSHFLDKGVRFKPEEIFSGFQMALIERYLKNYRRPSTYGYMEIMDLSRWMRNGLRGHGTFLPKDAMNLYKIIMKLALLMGRILQTDKISLRMGQHPVWKGEEFVEIYGSYGGLKEIRLSPFLIGRAKNGQILVFNNWFKNSFEYINYLDGNIIRPHYTQIEK